MEKSIYNLKLHEHILLKIGGSDEYLIDIIRVPGGWLYDERFVPYNAEFKIERPRWSFGCYVIVGINKGNNAFGICELSTFDPGNVELSYIDVREESEIVEALGEGHKFFTYSESTKSFTPVFEYKGEIRTIPNDQIDDNIGELPLID